MDNQTQEALKMAIEQAIIEFEVLSSFPQYDLDYVDMIKELRGCLEALEQPAPPAKTTSLEDVIKEFEKDPEMKALLDLARKQVKGMKLEQPAKKPYGWYDNHDIHNEKQSDESIALYTHPHQWQGLTDDEIDNISDDTLFEIGFNGLGIKAFGRAIEQALKEKNT